MVAVIGPDGHVRPWAEIEAEMIECAILSCNFNVTTAALRTGRGLFYRRIAGLAFRATDAEPLAPLSEQYLCLCRSRV